MEVSYSPQLKFTSKVGSMSRGGILKMNRINRILDTYRSTRGLESLADSIKLDNPKVQPYVKNDLIRARWMVIELYKSIEELRQEKRTYEKEYKHFESINDTVGRAETYLKISEVDNSIKSILNTIAEYGYIFIDILSSDILAEHDVCQLFNINWKTFQDEKKKYIEQFGKEDNLTYKVVTICGAEYRHRKSRANDFYDCDKYEMPVYWSITESIMHEMKNNREFKKATDEKFKELFPDIKFYRAVTDLEGNIIGYVNGEGLK